MYGNACSAVLISNYRTDHVLRTKQQQQIRKQKTQFAVFNPVYINILSDHSKLSDMVNVCRCACAVFVGVILVWVCLCVRPALEWREDKSREWQKVFRSGMCAAHVIKISVDVVRQLTYAFPCNAHKCDLIFSFRCQYCHMKSIHNPTNDRYVSISYRTARYCRHTHTHSHSINARPNLTKCWLARKQMWKIRKWNEAKYRTCISLLSPHPHFLYVYLARRMVVPSKATSDFRWEWKNFHVYYIINDSENENKKWDR